MSNSLFSTPEVQTEVAEKEETVTKSAVSSEVVSSVEENVVETSSEELSDVKPKRKYNPVKKSSYRGVSWSKSSKRWQVIINVGKNPETGKPKLQGAGVFDDELEAAKAYNEYVSSHGLNKKLNELPEE